ncbi:FAD-binding and (Fe-S)-binding domain-containing protein [Microcella sp.]|uniref:FAD-binding and (Fe-S)-binding domain-containing protein n=1 Tax=Microcella sp. TaxID=1913979 RepID=UPI002620A8DB|nr:FAD-binding and (Fe-S)-binding domain-containing protein [Microcella sp.]
MPLAGLLSAVADPGRVRTGAIDLVAYASDASHYLHTPEVVVVAADAAEVGAILRAAAESGRHVTFRSGGTSLSGQASGDSVMVDVRQRFRGIEVLDDGRRVRAQPGATVRQVNARLSRFGYRLGPDPASEVACTIGGVVANNSSGMACGIDENTYRTLESVILVLPSGTVIDSAHPDAEQHLLEREPALVEGLIALQRRVRENPDSVSIIERHFALKNTMGYGINSFLDHESPLDLLVHLLIGSEGTLGFVAEATFRTVEVRTLLATGIAVFPSLHAATSALPALVASGAATLELMDATSIRVGQTLADAPAEILGFEVGDEAALLIEYQGRDAQELAERVARGAAVLPDAMLRAPLELSADPHRRARAWAFRKGLYASVAGARPSGTTALLEDIAVPVEALADTCRSLQELFDRYGYADSVIFGHAKDGNIHFMLTDRFEGVEAIGRYLAFTDDLVELVLSHGGNLKAEHGTGRAMAPFVRRQYGDELYEVMRELKRLCDPEGILNPGVIIDDDPEAHIRNIKLSPSVEAEVDRCVECGYCEPVCPSRDLTLTPRQRIVVRRAEVAANESGDVALAAELAKAYDYAGVQTCAADGMCATACPVSIDTGALMKRLRRENASPVLAAGWSAAARNWATVSRVGSTALSVADALPAAPIVGVTAVARAVLGHETVPRYSSELPGGGAKRRSLRGSVGGAADAPVAVYLPACVSSMFGPGGEGGGATSALVALLERADVSVIVPESIEGLCCGTPWSSKGFSAGYDVMREKVLQSILDLTDGGRLPIVSDASSCTEGFHRMLEASGTRVIDAVTLVREHVLLRVAVTQRVGRLALHPTCSTRKMGIDGDAHAIAAAVADEVFVPESWGCCGFAGDRGMLHPELTASATADQAAEVVAADADVHASTNRTCELGMTRATGRTYEHVLELLERATRTLDTA